jgi:NAD(P)-dependent dehydrogenase (short-subunit alcohol dehydrogenase family)
VNDSSGRTDAGYLVGDLSQPASAAQIADAYRSRYERLDVLANIAGSVVFDKGLTPDGLDQSFAVNYLSHFALTHHLLELLVAAPSARVVTVAGSPKLLDKPALELDQLMGQGRYTAVNAAKQALFARAYFAFALARRLADTNVCSIAFHPGVVRSRLLSGAPALFRAIGALSNVFAKAGCESGVYAACSAALQNANGVFIDDKGETLSLPEKYDPAVGEQLWAMSETILEGCRPHRAFTGSH